MGNSIDAFNVIASDIGVKRFAGESEESFCRRAAYSAARFWMHVFCMDDGACGKRGLGKQAMNRRLKKWVASLDRICPGIDNWFYANGEGIRAVYSRMIDVGDLLPNGFMESYVTAPPAEVVLSESLSCISGYYDPTARRAQICGHNEDSLVLTGLLSLVRSENGSVSRPNSWWIEDLKYISWESAKQFDGVRFANVRASCWNINHTDVWSEEPSWADGLTLARVDDMSTPFIFIASKMRGRIYLSRITWIQAQELFFYLRSENENRAVSKYVKLDDLHVQARLPIGFVPGHMNRILDAAGWPVENAEDRFNRIIRVEAVPLVEELLAASYIGFEGVSND